MERNGDYIEKLSRCVHFVFNKLNIKYLRFLFYSPSYIDFFLHKRSQL